MPRRSRSWAMHLLRLSDSCWRFLREESHAGTRGALKHGSSWGLSQADFAAMLGVAVRTLQDWEQGRREPSGAAKALLKVTAAPNTVRKV